MGINDSGQIVGSYLDSNQRHSGFLYDGGMVTTISMPGATTTDAQGINADGQIMGEYFDNNNVRHGFLYDGSMFTTLDVPEAYGSTDEFFGINTSGQIVGRYVPVNDYYLRWHGFVYDERAFTTIELPPALDTSVFGINDAGEIVGMFGDNYKSQGFVGTPSQELVALGPVTLWIGLKNSDDQGTAFDLQAEVAINSALVATARTLCIAGVTRNPDKATEAMILFGSFPPVSVPADAALSLTIRTRIGTNPDGTQCSGHSNAVGVRLYYDAETRPSRLGMELTPDLPEDFFLHSDSRGDYLDATVPTASTARFKSSSALNFKNGNPWKAIGTWSLKPSQNIVYAGAE